MKEITRIHIAKIAFDIELNAKKELESYIAALEQYAGDEELLADIEIRITELLAEHGVQADGVISSDDVNAVRAQLGEPSDFAPESEVIKEANDEPRRVYRDEEGAMLGGVLAGLARYFGVDPLWVRLVFVVLLFGSFGAVTLVYFILWLIIPAARTSADKLQMDGRPVTLASLKAFGERAEPTIGQTAQTARRLLRVIVGIGLIIGSLLILGVIIVAAARLFLGIPNGPGIAGLTRDEAWWTVVAGALFAAAGVLLSALGMVLANAILRRVWNKRIGTAVVVIIVAGLVAFSGGIGALVAGRAAIEAQVQRDSKITSSSLPEEFKNIKTLHVLADTSGIGVGNTDITVIYTVSSTPRYEFNGFSGLRPELKLSQDGLSMTAKVDNEDFRQHGKGYFGSVELHIFGSALDEIRTDINSPWVTYQNEQPQEILATKVRGNGLSVLGTYATAHVFGEEYSRVIMNQATVSNLVVDSKKGMVEAGVVRTLNVTQSDVCEIGSLEDNQISVQAVSGGKIIYNGTEQPVRTVSNNCGEVIIDSDQNS